MWRIETWFIDCNNICHTSYNQTAHNRDTKKVLEKMARMPNKTIQYVYLCVDLVLFWCHFGGQKRHHKAMIHSALKNRVRSRVIEYESTLDTIPNKQYLFSGLSFQIPFKKLPHHGAIQFFLAALKRVKTSLKRCWHLWKCWWCWEKCARMRVYIPLERNVYIYIVDGQWKNQPILGVNRWT